MVRVGIVVVSHSDLLARGVVELASQMAVDVHFEAAGGTEDAGIGTSYDTIETAVHAALAAVGEEDGGGVLVLTDLGSATMTVDSVLEFADEPERLVFVDCPLVEGCVAASVRAQIGDDLAAVAAAARASRRGPWRDDDEQDADAENMQTPGGARNTISGDTITATARIVDPVGLHARPAAILAQIAEGFDAEVLINEADAESTLEMMALGVKQGETVTLSAVGPQAREALDALVAAIETAT